MKSVKLRCGCWVEGEPPNVHHIWLCKNHRLVEKARGTPLIGDVLKKVGGDVHERG